jgi:hypothetical protein
MKPHCSIWVARMWCGICTNPVLRCFDNLEGVSCEDVLVDVVPEHHSDKSGSDWSLGHCSWVRASQGKCLFYRTKQGPMPPPQSNLDQVVSSVFSG